MPPSSVLKVAIFGATGETGSSIVNGLLESTSAFGITALTRPSSLDKSRNASLKERGINVIPYDVNSSFDQQVEALRGIDVVIAAVGPAGLQDQIPLADAAKTAGVKRFVPSFFATAIPPKGVVGIREQKEDVLSYIKTLGLGYTVIDVGWWMHGLLPALPSGRTDYVRVDMPPGTNTVVGDGNVLCAVTETADVGRFVAHVIADPRTLNKMVFVYADVITMNQAFDLMEKLSGEIFERRHTTEAEVATGIAQTQEAIAKGSADWPTAFKLHVLQYVHSWAIRGDNTPEYAEYLGYLNGRELYPDLKGISVESFFANVLGGKAKKLYADGS